MSLPGTDERASLDHNVAQFVKRTERLLGHGRVWHDKLSCELYSYDASLEKRSPDVVVVPRSTDDLAPIVMSARQHGLPLVMRGAGTGYSGGALADRGGVVVLTRDLNRVLEVNSDERWMRCEPGVVLADAQQAALNEGLRYLPDPSSYRVCTVGGNVAENAGGPHALGGGPTSNYVMELDVVLPDGSAARFSETDPWVGGLDLRGLFVGSEGTLGVIRGVKLRLVSGSIQRRVLVATFDQHDAAIATVESVLQGGVLPSALDMLTGAFIPHRADVSDPSLLFVGLEARSVEVEDQALTVQDVVRDHGGSFRSLSIDAFLEHRAELVKAKVRRMVQLSGKPRYYLFDAVAPRGRLRELVGVLRDAATEFDLPMLNTFHAGDGNVHPTPFYSPRDPRHREVLLEFSERILKECAQMGGALSGEHGIGLEKRELMPSFHSPQELAVMRAVKLAFDDRDSCNPGKILAVATKERSVARRDVLSDLGPLDVRVDIDNGVVEIGCGVSFSDLESALAKTLFEVPYEPLGGSIGLSVCHSIDRGRPALREPVSPRPRDLIVAAVLRRPSQESLITGGWCVKDVSGYELRKLVYGARGRLGELAVLRLRLLPKPSDTRLVRSEPMEFRDAVELCRRVHRCQLPFAHLGVLRRGNAGSWVVEGRMQLFGGRLDTDLASLRELPLREVPTDHFWSDGAMIALGGAAASPVPAAPWTLECTEADTLYGSATQALCWKPRVDGRSSGDDQLDTLVSAAFRS